MQTQKLKLGLYLIHSMFLHGYMVFIQRIVNESSSEFVLVFLNEDTGKSNKINISTSVYSIFNRIDEKIFTKSQILLPQKVSQKYCRK